MWNEEFFQRMDLELQDLKCTDSVLRNRTVRSVMDVPYDMVP